MAGKNRLVKKKVSAKSMNSLYTPDAAAASTEADVSELSCHSHFPQIIEYFPALNIEFSENPIKNYGSSL